MIKTTIFKFFIINLWQFNFLYYLCTVFQTCCVIYAQMAESVDALVSNTSGATRAGSTPALGTRSENDISAASDNVLQHFF